MGDSLGFLSIKDSLAGHDKKAQVYFDRTLHERLRHFLSFTTITSKNHATLHEAESIRFSTVHCTALHCEKWSTEGNVYRL